MQIILDLTDFLNETGHSQQFKEFEELLKLLREYKYKDFWWGISLTTFYHIEDNWQVHLSFCVDGVEYESSMVYYPCIRLCIRKYILDNVFKEIKKDFNLPENLDLYPTLDRAVLFIWEGKVKLELNMDRLLTQLLGTGASVYKVLNY